MILPQPAEEQRIPFPSTLRELLYCSAATKLNNEATNFRWFQKLSILSAGTSRWMQHVFDTLAISAIGNSKIKIPPNLSFYIYIYIVCSN
jgi:hypothetical protein